jgi:hypothetical protein
MAWRTAISLLRAVARARVRLAMLEHAISSICRDPQGLRFGLDQQ